MRTNSDISQSIEKIKAMEDYEERLGRAVYNAVMTDEETLTHIGRAILFTASQNPEQLQAIEDTLIAICGWSFDSLIHKMEE